MWSIGSANNHSERQFPPAPTWIFKVYAYDHSVWTHAADPGTRPGPPCCNPLMHLKPLTALQPVKKGSRMFLLTRASLACTITSLLPHWLTARSAHALLPSLMPAPAPFWAWKIALDKPCSLRFWQNPAHHSLPTGLPTVYVLLYMQPSACRG